MMAKPTTRASVCEMGTKPLQWPKVATSPRWTRSANAGSPTHPMPSDVSVTPNWIVLR